jgi:hypothetical protein
MTYMHIADASKHAVTELTWQFKHEEQHTQKLDHASLPRPRRPNRVKQQKKQKHNRMQAKHSTNTRGSHTMDTQKVPGHPQERVVGRQQGKPSARGGPQDHKILQELPKTRNSLPLHFLQRSSGLLQPLLLHLLLTVQLTLLNLCPVLLLSSRGLCGLKKLRDKLLIGRDIRQLVLLGCQRCLLPVHTKMIRSLTADVHDTAGHATRHTPLCEERPAGALSTSSSSLYCYIEI